MLAPGVTFAVVFQVFDRLIPMSNGRKVARRRLTGGLPTIEEDGRKGGLIVKGSQRNTAVRLAVVGSPCEQCRVGCHEIDVPLFTVGNAELMHYGVGFKIDPDGTSHVLVAQNRSAEKIEDGVGTGVQIFHLKL